MSDEIIIKSKNIITPNGSRPGYIIIKEGKIKNIKEDSKSFEQIGGVFYDFDNEYIIPGFVDLHIHGAGGFQVDKDADNLLEMAHYLLENGTTVFYPTISSLPKKEIIRIIKVIKEAKQRQQKKLNNKSGAKIAGIHLEGPFLSKEKKGAMTEEYLQTSSIQDIDDYLKVADSLIKRITIAPEINGALDLIEYASKKGLIVAAGHTNGTYEEIIKSIDLGVKVANHMYNAMSSLHHRRPNAVGAFLTDDRVICEIIGDLIHVNKVVLKLTIDIKGIDNMYLISDAIIAAGLKPGKYYFTDRDIYIDESGTSRLANGTIAGSTSLLIEGFRNLINELSYSISEAVKLTSTNASIVAGIDNKKGSIEVGKDADLLILNKDLEIKNIIIANKVI